MKDINVYKNFIDFKDFTHITFLIQFSLKIIFKKLNKIKNNNSQSFLNKKHKKIFKK